jgi:hypothetical protein
MRRAFLALAFASLFLAPAFGADPHIVDLQLGTFRPPYFYPVMDLGYRSPGLFGPFGLRMEMRVRSFGTFYVLNPASYDLSLMVTFDALRSDAWTAFLGAGLDWKLRFTHYLPPGGIEPVIALGARFDAPRLSISPALLTRFYADGLSLTLQPEACWDFGRLGLTFRSELSCLLRYDALQSGWALNNYAGFRFEIP